MAPSTRHIRKKPAADATRTPSLRPHPRTSGESIVMAAVHEDDGGDAAEEAAELQLLRTHAEQMGTALTLLEEPATQRAASAVSLQRAAERGHTWLARLSSKGHASHVVEPGLLASVRAPPITYVPAIPRRVGKSGVLSELQLEAVLHAGQCHAQPLRPSGTRPGFLLADGAGVGKGRTQAAIILDAWLQGHQKASHCPRPHAALPCGRGLALMPPSSMPHPGFDAVLLSHHALPSRALRMAPRLHPSASARVPPQKPFGAPTASRPAALLTLRRLAPHAGAVGLCLRRSVCRRPARLASRVLGCGGDAALTPHADLPHQARLSPANSRHPRENACRRQRPRFSGAPALLWRAVLVATISRCPSVPDPRCLSLPARIRSVPQHSPIPTTRGVVFASYALLARPARLAQVLAWCSARVPFQGASHAAVVAAPFIASTSLAAIPPLPSSLTPAPACICAHSRLPPSSPPASHRPRMPWFAPCTHGRLPCAPPRVLHPVCCSLARRRTRPG